MHRTNKTPQAIFTIPMILLLAANVLVAGIHSESNAWDGYTWQQKQVAVAGFADCYRTGSPNKNAFAETDMVAATRIADESASSRKGAEFGDVILQSIKKAGHAGGAKNAEHWNGPTGFHDGMWWRGIDEREREAYVQGVFWCAQAVKSVAISSVNQTPHQTIKDLDKWYVVADDDWKDARSSARVDISVITALQRLRIVRINKVTPKP